MRQQGSEDLAPTGRDRPAPSVVAIPTELSQPTQLISNLSFLNQIIINVVY
jgi:hypothetical protein